MSSIVFVSSFADTQYILNLSNKLDLNQIKIICNFPPAFDLLSKHNLKIIDSQSYFPVSEKSLANYQKIVIESQILSQSNPLISQLSYRQYKLGDILSYSLAIYLAEVHHSFLVAAEILRQEKPRKIYVSPSLTESPMKTYQSGDLNCENIALLELAKKQNIKIIEINSHKIKDSWQILNQIVKQLGGGFIYSIKQFLATEKLIKAPSIVFLANHYQLANFIPAMQSFAKNKTPYIAIGKADRELNQCIVDKKIPFINYSSQTPIKTSINNLKLVLTLKYLFFWFCHQSVLKKEFTRDKYWPLIKPKLFYYYLSLIPQLIETLTFADFIFRQKPKVLLTTATNDVFSKCFALSAKHNATKVIEIQHGLLILDVDAPFRYNDIYAVWGKDVIPLLDQTLAPQNPKVVGYPYTINPPNKSKQKLLAKAGRQKLGISPNEKVILILGAFPTTITRFFSPISTLGFINLLIKGVHATQEKWTIIIRPHPSYNPDWIKNLPIPKSIKLILDQRQIPLDEEVAAADIVIANHTTTIFEALIQNKPLFLYLFLNPKVNHLKFEILTKNTAPLFHTSEQLTEMLNNISINDNSCNKKHIDILLGNYFSLPQKISVTQNLLNLLKHYGLKAAESL